MKTADATWIIYNLIRDALENGDLRRVPEDPSVVWKPKSTNSKTFVVGFGDWVDDNGKFLETENFVIEVKRVRH